MVLQVRVVKTGRTEASKILKLNNQKKPPPPTPYIFKTLWIHDWIWTGIKSWYLKW